MRSLRPAGDPHRRGELDDLFVDRMHAGAFRHGELQ
jgi:hypothetical protein